MSAYRVYELYGAPGGRPSAHSGNYHGDVMLVAAHSIKQAYYVASSDEWIDPHRDKPVGILSHYSRGDDGPMLWCGCRARLLGVKHGSGVRAVRAAIERHACEVTA